MILWGKSDMEGVPPAPHSVTFAPHRVALVPCFVYCASLFAQCIYDFNFTGQYIIQHVVMCLIIVDLQNGLNVH